MNWCLLLILSVGLSAVAASGADLAKANASLRSQLHALSLQDDFPPGAVAAFVLPDGEVGIAATGWADPEKRLPMTAETRFLAASIGKTFGAALVLELAQEGLLHIDDRIDLWLGSEAWFKRLPNSSTITIRQLLNQTSGVPDHVFTWSFGWAMVRRWVTGRGGVALTPVELIEFILDRDSIAPAGSGFGYSDTGYILLGLIAERATGDSYYALVQKRFLDPLGLSLTVPSDRVRLPNLAAGYLDPICWLPSIKTMRDGELRVNPASEWAGGGFATNPRDLARWAMLFYGNGALPEPYLDAMLSSKVSVREGVFYIPAGFVYETRLGRAFAHGGWIPGYTSYMLYLPERRLSVAIQLNSDCGVLDNRAKDYAFAITGAITESLGAVAPAALYGAGAVKPSDSSS